MKMICVALGTRPEASKMAPVIYALRDMGLQTWLLSTGQHREQLDDMLNIFNLKADADLALMRGGQSLAELMGRMLPLVATYLRELKPDYVLVHGDTLTTFTVALASYFEGIPVAHVEAGLRSFNLKEPFPEEGNRRLTDVLTDLDLPPTVWAKDNLLKEGKAPEKMVITGNTAIDAVKMLAGKAELPERFRGKKLITLTMHRRENLPHMAEMAACLADLARGYPEFTWVYPLHLNPLVREAVTPALGGVGNVGLEPPLDYLNLLALMKSSELIVTDSGGLQEEGTALGIPVAVLRNTTERPEGLSAGTLVLAGNTSQTMTAVLEPLLADATARQKMQTGKNPYGDGLAAPRIAQAVAWRLGLAQRPKDWYWQGEANG